MNEILQVEAEYFGSIIQEMDEKIKRYEDVLQFYANKEKYFVDMEELELPEDILHAKPSITYDMGKRAREVLEEFNNAK